MPKATDTPQRMPTATNSPQRAGELDWAAFQARYFPESHRHDHKAIAAYGAYKSDPTRQAKQVDSIAKADVAIDTWEGEGGASRTD